MTIYFSGVGGVGIGPLMEIAHDAGYDVAGSDTTDNLMTNQLRERGLDVFIGQTGQEIARVHAKTPIDWLVYTAAAPADNPERLFAEQHGIRSSKRDEFLAQIIAEKQLKLIAVAGTQVFFNFNKQIGVTETNLVANCGTIEAHILFTRNLSHNAFLSNTKGFH